MFVWLKYEKGDIYHLSVTFDARDDYISTEFTSDCARVTLSEHPVLPPAVFHPRFYHICVSLDLSTQTVIQAAIDGDVCHLTQTKGAAEEVEIPSKRGVSLQLGLKIGQYSDAGDIEAFVFDQCLVFAGLPTLHTLQQYCLPLDHTLLYGWTGVHPLPNALYQQKLTAFSEQDTAVVTLDESHLSV